MMLMGTVGKWTTCGDKRQKSSDIIQNSDFIDLSAMQKPLGYLAIETVA